MNKKLRIALGKLILVTNRLEVEAKKRCMVHSVTIRTWGGCMIPDNTEFKTKIRLHTNDN